MSDVQVVCARSFNSGLKSLAVGAKRFDLVLLDMTMPTYDVTPSEPTGGSIEHFAGRDLLAQMKLRQIDISVAVITMFVSFGEGSKKMSLANLSQELHSQVWEAVPRARVLQRNGGRLASLIAYTNRQTREEEGPVKNFDGR